MFSRIPSFLKPVIVLSLILGSVGCEGRKSASSSEPSPTSSSAATKLKIITYNVNRAFSNPQNVADFLAESDSDVVCLQETHAQWEKFLRERLGSRYSYIIFNNARGAGGTAILSKYPLSEVQVLKPESGWFPALTAKILTPLGPVRFLNVHLHPAVSEEGKITAAALYSTGKTRLEEMRGFMKTMPGDIPIIILGDFNEEEDGKAFKYLLDQEYTNALSLFDTKSKTWRWKTKYMTLERRLDHILFNDPLSCESARVAEVQASDHFPVEAVLSINDN